MANNHRHSWRERTEASRGQMKRIDVLPDDVLLGIFDFYMDTSLLYKLKKTIEAWQSLVHVCRRWRNLVLGSPRRLNLRLYCTPKTPARDTLDAWPPFPLIISGDMSLSGPENVIAALGQSNRVSEVALWKFAGWQFEKVLAAMQAPFPELTYLQFVSDDETVPVIPDSGSFLDGSAPRLQRFTLNGIPFPGLPKLLSSAHDLVSLSLINIPHSGYISPEAMVALLSVLPNLKRLMLEFRSPQSHPDLERRSLPPSKRSVIPALSQIRFKGVTEYLEDLVNFIDAPQLDRLHITFFNQIDFECPRLAQFINCTPTLRALDDAHVQFNETIASIKFRCQTTKSRLDDLLIRVLCRQSDWQLSSIEQVCDSSLHPLSTVGDLYIGRPYRESLWKNDAIENSLWLQLFLPFTAVKNLYLSKKFAPGIAAALKELVEGRITEVLPSLQNIFVEGLRAEPSGPVQENIEHFTGARQHSGHPIAVSFRDRRRR